MAACPCMNCTERDAKCHSICTKYLEWFSMVQAEKEKGSFEAYDLLKKNKDKFNFKRVHRH